MSPYVLAWAMVPLAVMPEGVEHFFTTTHPAGISAVPLAVMPEGVEHKATSLSLCFT